MYYVYILRCSDNSLYTGITTDLEKRFSQHFTKCREAAKYTRSRQVLSVEAVWSAHDRSAASKLEYRIKGLTKPQKEALISSPQTLGDVLGDKLDISNYTLYNYIASK
ncbi:MAG: GIY-YIG nuclease family protein [Clostridia bacterium]|nr:GIY-YIG nuclease family protein [Clostridia bacterium]